MSETRKNHLSIDGGQVKDDKEHTASYKPIAESDPEFRSSKTGLSKSKEKVSADGAEEKLLQKEIRVDMVDAKYVVGSPQNGDAKIEVDANRKQFSGLTKEELLKYADDPFWVRLRWFMFILFWALWFCMLAGAIVIIVKAPKCAPPAPKTWYQKGPLVDLSTQELSEIEDELTQLEANSVQGIFINICPDTYSVLDDTTCLDKFKAFAEKVKKQSIKLIVDLTANMVSTTHKWFKQSENKTPEFEQYFIWANGGDFDEALGRPKPPSNWVSVTNEEAWSWSPNRQQYYLHQLGSGADLNLKNPDVVKHFDSVLKKWMSAGANGVRLLHARQLIINESLGNEEYTFKDSAGHWEYSSLKHTYSADQPGLVPLLQHWAHVVATSSEEETAFTVSEELRDVNVTFLRPPAARPADLTQLSAVQAAAFISKRLPLWPLLQLVGTQKSAPELAAFSTLLPAAPLLTLPQLTKYSNNTVKVHSFGDVVSLRSDATVQNGRYNITAVPAVDSNEQLLAIIRWKAGHTGYAAVFNPGGAACRANLSAMPRVPPSLAVRHVSANTALYTNYTINFGVKNSDITVPAHSTVVLSFVPTTEN